MSREGHDPIEPVVAGNVRYEAIHRGKAIGLEQNGGYVAAIDPKTGWELWLVRVYAIDHGADKEPDRLDVFITTMTLAADGRHILVADENGRSFSIDLATRAVNPVTAPAYR
jgi:hypothetical protein